MSSKAYRTIVVLLGLALASFFVIQFLWINNSLKVAEEEIFRGTQDALSETSKKLERRSNLSEIKNNFSIESGDSVPGGKTKMKIIMSSGSGDTMFKKIMHDNKITLKSVPVVPNVPEIPEIPNKRIRTRNSIQIKNGKTIIVNQQIDTESGDTLTEDINVLVEKMMMEVSSIDVSPLTKMKPDTLKNILQRELKQKGIEAPFEFAVLKGSANDSVIFSSAGFNKGSMASNNYNIVIHENILKKNDRLVFYYASQKSLVFSRLKTLLWLSAFFALFILGIFIVTLRLILKQKKLSEIKNDFINNMTHELKTPIATISIAADALKNPKVKSDNEKLDYYSSVIKEENNKMNRNVEKVLQLALTDKNEFQPEFSEIEISQLVKKCISNFEVLFASKNIECEFFPEAEKVFVKADAFHLENAINNLIDNASKYASLNPHIVIRTKNSGEKIILSVEDNGIGMSSELQKKIFDKFYRAQTGNIHDVKGFGIGLSYAYNIVKAHKGTISVKSEAGKGSVFTIELPVTG